MKTCPACQKPLPDEARICPACMTALSEKKTIKQPRLWKKTTLRIIACAVLVIAVIFITMTVLRHNTIIEGNGEVIAAMDGDDWHFVLRCSHNDLLHITTPEDTYVKSIIQGSMAACPSQLYIFTGTGDNAINRKDRFADVVKSCSIEIKAAKGTAASASTPVYSAGFPDAALESDITYTDSCSENDICWILELKDGRTVKIHQYLNISSLEPVEYSYRDMPLSDTDELNSLLAEIQKENDATKSYTIILAPETYEGDIIIDEAAVRLQGTKNADVQTEICGTIFIKASVPFTAELNGLVFTGEGTGVIDNAGFFADSCTFKGLDTGIDALDGGYPIPYDCTFEDCQTGLHFQSTNSRSKSPWFINNTFTNNDIAVLLDMVPGTDILHFDGCIFSGNGLDIVNNTKHEVIIS